MDNLICGTPPTPVKGLWLNCQRKVLIA